MRQEGTGTYDIDLEFVRDELRGAAPAGAVDVPPAPSIATALQEQLGLKVVPGKPLRAFPSICTARSKNPFRAHGLRIRMPPNVSLISLEGAGAGTPCRNHSTTSPFYA